MMNSLILLTITLSLMEAAPTYSTSLGDCQKFASKFANTCNATLAAPAFTSLNSTSYSCKSVGQCTGSTGANATCTWFRRLCVTCRLIKNETYIRVQTNGLPNHCYNSPTFTLNNQTIDFEVKFNWKVGNTTYNTPNGQDTVNSLVCNT